MTFNGKYSVISFDEEGKKEDENIKFSTLDDSIKAAKKMVVDIALQYVKEHEKGHQFSPCFENVDSSKIDIYPFISYDKLVQEHEDKFRHGVIIMQSEKKDKFIESYEILKIETSIERSFRTMFIGYTVKKIKLLKVVVVKENLATQEQLLEELKEVFAKKAKKIEQTSTTGYDEQGNPVKIDI